MLYCLIPNLYNNKVVRAIFSAVEALQPACNFRQLCQHCLLVDKFFSIQVIEPSSIVMVGGTALHCSTTSYEVTSYI